MVSNKQKDTRYFVGPFSETNPYECVKRIYSKAIHGDHENQHLHV